MCPDLGVFLRTLVPQVPRNAQKFLSGPLRELWRWFQIEDQEVSTVTCGVITLVGWHVMMYIITSDFYRHILYSLCYVWLFEVVTFTTTLLRGCMIGRLGSVLKYPYLSTMDVVSTSGFSLTWAAEKQSKAHRWWKGIDIICLWDAKLLCTICSEHYTH